VDGSWVGGAADEEEEKVVVVVVEREGHSGEEMGIFLFVLLFFKRWYN